MKQSPLRMRSPTTSMPGSRAPSRISLAGVPVASSACVRAFTVSAFPSIKAALSWSFTVVLSSFGRCQAVTETPAALSVSSTMARIRAATSAATGSGLYSWITSRAFSTQR